MARIKPLLPTAIAGGKAKPNFTETDWKRIESAYGKKLYIKQCSKENSRSHATISRMGGI